MKKFIPILGAIPIIFCSHLELSGQSTIDVINEEWQGGTYQNQEYLIHEHLRINPVGSLLPGFSARFNTEVVEVPIIWQDFDDRIDVLTDNRLYNHDVSGAARLVPSQQVIDVDMNGWIEFVWDNRKIHIIVGLQPVGSPPSYIEPKFRITDDGLTIQDSDGIARTFSWANYMGAKCRLGKMGPKYFFYVNGNLEYVTTAEDVPVEISVDFVGDIAGKSPMITCFNTTGSVEPDQEEVSEVPSNSFSHFEGFESETSSWTNISSHLNISDDLDWTRLEGNTKSKNTGPNGAYEGDYYQYIESSTNGTGYPYKEAYFLSPELSISEGWTQKEFTFWYHMYGSNIDKSKLAVYLSIDGADWGATPIYEIDGTSSNTWIETTVDLSQYQGQTLRLAIYGLTGDGYRSDIAVDNLYFEFTREEVINEFPYHESFESDNSIWVNETVDAIDWTRYMGPSPSDGTGPDEASDGLAYMYVEASAPNHPNKWAAITTPKIDLTNQVNSTLSFDYNMNGIHSNKLELRVKEAGSSTWTEIWETLGDKLNAWHSIVLDLSAYDSKIIQIRFNGDTGSGSKSDVAIDNVNVYERPVATQALEAQNITHETFLASWNAVPDIQNYKLYVATDAEFLNYVAGYNGKVITGTEETVTGLSPLTTYYYKVRAVDDHGMMSMDSNSITLATLKGSDVPTGALTVPYQDGWSSGASAYDFINITPTMPQSTCESNAYNQWHFFEPDDDAISIQIAADFYPIKVTVWVDQGAGSYTELRCYEDIDDGLIDIVERGLQIGQKYLLSISSESENAGSYGLTVAIPTEFWSRASGSWDDTNTWSIGQSETLASRLPLAIDEVHIEGHSVDLTGNQQTGNITVHVNSENTGLTVSDHANITVYGSIMILGDGSTGGIVIDETSQLRCVEPDL